MQTNRNLLLSREALVHSTPQLEILADDVKCKHGSTTGQLDPLALFYLRSRGIGEAAARSLLTWAFAGDLLRGVRVDAVPQRGRAAPAGAPARRRGRAGGALVSGRRPPPCPRRPPGTSRRCAASSRSSRETVHGKPLVYLDSAASAQKPQAVIDAEREVYERGYANIHRGVHRLSQLATEAYERARGTVRRFLNAADTREVVFAARHDRGDQPGGAERTAGSTSAPATRC